MAQTMSIPDFVRHGWREETPIDAFLAHLERHKIKYRVVGTAIILFLGFADLSFASESVSAFAQQSTGIDAGANKLYKRIVNVGKWIIIIKGGIEMIKSGVDGDMPGVKKNFMSYGLTYASLWALPWLFGEIDKLFGEMEASAQ